MPMNTKLELVGIEGVHVNIGRGEINIKNISLRFDPKSVDLDLDLLDALDLVVQAVRSGTIKPTYMI